MQMINRREFMHCSGAAAATLSLPLSSTLNAAGEETLPARTIPGTDEQLPIIGLGNSQAFQSGNLELSRQLLELFMERGGAYVDSSGAGRFTVGRVMVEKGAEEALFLGNYISATEDKSGRQEIRAVREGQGGGPLDLVHTRNVHDFAAHPGKYRRWKDDGLTRYLGVARPNMRYYEVMMKLMKAGAVDFVQVNYSMLEPEAEERLLPMAQDLGIAVVINRPFINGQYFSLVKDQTLPEWAADFDCETWAQFSLKFILANPAVNCVLTETSNPRHAADNLGAGVGRLPDEKTRRRMLQVMQDLP
jgi:diketogulonate reductase-like aldo/keto reductase